MQAYDRDREPTVERAARRGQDTRRAARELAAGQVSSSAIRMAQRSIGNAATGRLVARRTRSAGRGELLVKDRRPLLKRGSRGQDVLDVQYDLDFVGADPALVLDGIFGTNTQAAVTDFQAANGLESDGIVGPLTRGALEASMREHDAPGSDGPDTLDRGGGALDSAPAQPASAGNLLGIPAARPPAPVSFTAHDFRAAVGDLAVANGQFLFSDALADHLVAEIHRISPPSAPSADAVLLKDLVKTALEAGFEPKMQAAEARPAASWSPPDLRKLLGVGKSRSKGTGDAIVQKLWSAHRKPGSPTPSLAGMTISDLRAVFNWEVVACFTTAERLAGKFADATKGRAPRRTATMLPNLTVMASLKPKTKTQRAADFAALRAGTPRVDGDVVHYNDRLPKIVAQMKAALADGWTLHARVVSGIHLELAGPGTPNEEHSLLIFAARGNEFLCFDPDLASNRNIPDRRMPRNGRAFQSLFFDPAKNRLTTAKDDASFPVDAGGRDINGVHRYQVVRVFTANHPFLSGEQPR
jgi:peptidoglycan hydrolase-like protein with peptidoglycan-binding domain